MKKAALILLICIYGFSTFGVSLKEFYCCGKLKSVTLTTANDLKEKCGMGDNTDGCCKTKFQFYKVKDNHFASDGLSSPTKYFSDFHLCTAYIQIVPSVFQKVEILNSTHAPPLYNGTPLYISNCVFRI